MNSNPNNPANLSGGEWMQGGGFTGPTLPFTGNKIFVQQQPTGILGSGISFGDIFSVGTGILQGLAGLRQAQMAEQQLKLAKQQFGFQKGLANRNLANQAKLINNQYDSSAQVAAGMIGGVDANGNYGMTDKAIVDQYANAAKDKYVDGSAIG